MRSTATAAPPTDEAEHAKNQVTLPIVASTVQSRTSGSGLGGSAACLIHVRRETRPRIPRQTPFVGFGRESTLPAG